MPALIEVGQFFQTKYEWGEGALLAPGKFIEVPHYTKAGKLSYVIHAEAARTLVLQSDLKRGEPEVIRKPDGTLVKNIPAICIATVTE